MKEPVFASFVFVNLFRKGTSARQTDGKAFFLHMKCHVSVSNKQSLVCGCVELSWWHEGCFPLALIWRSRFKRRTRLYRCCPGDIWALASEAAPYDGVSPRRLLEEINVFMPSWVSYLCSQGIGSGNWCSRAKPDGIFFAAIISYRQHQSISWGGFSRWEFLWGHICTWNPKAKV